MRQDARENRERILAAAEVVFGARGATGSTEEVAQRAGVGIATVFRHFPTKETLVEAALLRHFDHLTTLAQHSVASPDPGSAWSALVRTMIKTGATKLALATILADRGELPERAAAASSRLKAAVEQALQRAQHRGVVRPGVAVEEVYLLIRGLAQASATIATQPDILDRAIDLVLDGLSPPNDLP